MYDLCIDQMVQAGVARKRDNAVWVDKNSKTVSDKSLAFGCKVTHDLIHPDWCIVGVISWVGTSQQRKMAMLDGDFTLQ